MRSTTDFGLGVHVTPSLTHPKFRFHLSTQPQGGFQKLIKVNILAHCKRRQPLDISAMLSDKEVRVLQRKFSPGLKRLFQYYATGSPANTVRCYSEMACFV